MNSTCTRFALAAALCATAAPALAGVHDFEWAPQAQSETIGTPRDPADGAASAARLQRNLAARQVERGLSAPAVVQLTADETGRVNDTTAREMKYFVGVAKPAAIAVDFAPARSLGTRTASLALGAARGTGDGGFVWSAAVRSPGATAMRLHISGFDLPQGAEMYVYNLRGQAFGPYTGRGPLGNGELHTHTVFGDQVLMQLRAGSDAARLPKLTIAQIGVMGERFLAARFGPVGGANDGDVKNLVGASHAKNCSYNADCVENEACHTSAVVTAAKDAVASILYLSSGNYYICSGGLLADTDTNTVVPLFLTANHCVSNSTSANSVETYFDYETPCGDETCTQPYNNAGDTIGASILSTSSTSDYTLLRLSAPPTTRDGVATYLGWNSSVIANTNNAALYRISHPSGAPQAYSEHVVDTTKGTCRTWPRGNWIYSRDTFGATEGGSSGSVVLNSASQVVGQLSGACGFNVNDNCDPASNATVDGALAAYYSKVASWLSPGSGGGGGGGECSVKGTSCTSGSQCCSGSCGGKPGNKTCK